MKKIMALILCAAMLSFALYGCSGNADNAPSEDPPSENGAPDDDSVNGGPIPGIDYDAAFQTFTPDTVMINDGELKVTWAELFFFLRSNLNALISSVGMLPDLSLPLPDGRTYSETLMDYAVENALQYLSFEYGAMVTGVTLSEEEQKQMDESFESMVETFGSEAAFLGVLKTQYGIFDFEVFKRFIYMDYLPVAIFYDLYGQDAEFLSDEEAAEFTADHGYLMVKHILLMRTEDDTDTPRIVLEDILNQLDNYDGDDFEGFFDELMFDNTEDSDGLSIFPDGYLFQFGDMEAPFYEAAAALEIGEISGIVESEHGYHIVLRIPINFDAVPISLLSVGDFTSLRLLVAFDMFDATLSEWRENLSPIFTAEFESIDIAAIFSES